jgi:hypothetical protein
MSITGEKKYKQATNSDLPQFQPHEATPESVERLLKV